ncbi:MAG: hypothetical protein ACT4P4_03840 [Betaproteobacteria bacterium]
MATDLVLKMLREIRAEAKESRRETRDNFGKVFHRLAVLDTQMGDARSRLGLLERHMAALLISFHACYQRAHRQTRGAIGRARGARLELKLN